VWRLVEEQPLEEQLQVQQNEQEGFQKIDEELLFGIGLVKEAVRTGKKRKLSTTRHICFGKERTVLLRVRLFVALVRVSFLNNLLKTIKSI
tara:strand:+ start:176 stop:448 length:273 start_codon:yes stop_codon:yes gene_type:complete